MTITAWFLLAALVASVALNVFLDRLHSEALGYAREALELADAWRDKAHRCADVLARYVAKTDKG